ncbi:MAG: lamin tail domain-containing protein, partial [Candidatus Krumholzibacteria bacterium]|nr:lamin tail domain-containing protein [Candidatus Krumholzibacteria bacterium]
EIINTGSNTVDLGVYRITDQSAGKVFRYALSGSIAPGETRVIYGTQVVAWQTANSVSAFGFSLNNSGDTVYLYRITGTDTTAVDSYAYASIQIADDRAVGRLPDGGEPWVIFDALNSYKGDDYPVAAGCLPSPGGFANCPTPTKASTWGNVKSKFSKK